MNEQTSQDVRDVRAVLAARADKTPSARGLAEAAFARLYDRHGSLVRAACRVHSVSDEDADDALQETFMRAYRLMHELDAPEGVRSWLYAIARHVCSEKRRAGGRRGKHERVAGELAGRNGRAPRPDAGTEKSEEHERLTAALAELPEDERLAVHLFYTDGQGVDAARTDMGLSRSGFYKLLARARERLAAVLQQGAR